MIPDETHFLNALKDIVASGRTPAEELLAHYHGDWGGDPRHVFKEYSY
jgi:glutamate--cysteine ligase